MTRYYYAAYNTHGNESSIGFANTWMVMSFKSLLDRKSFIDSESPSNISIKAVTRLQAKQIDPQAIEYPHLYTQKSKETTQ